LVQDLVIRMGSVKENMDSTTLVTQKNHIILVALDQLFQEQGWRKIEEHFGVADYHLIYVKDESILNKIDIKAAVLGGLLRVNFVGQARPKGFIQKLLDLNSTEIPKTFKTDSYVSNDLKLLCEDKMRNIATVIIKELEAAAA